VSTDILRASWDLLVSLWWISWFGIIGAFLLVGIRAYRYVSPQRSAASHSSLALLIVTIFLWVLFYAVDEKARGRVDGEKNKQVVVELLTIAGTFLAVFTLLGIFFFIYIAPRIR